MRIDDIFGYRMPDINFVNGWCELCGAMVGYEKGSSVLVGPSNPYITRHVEAWKTNHVAFHSETISRSEARKLSSVLWCDKENHPFKAGEEGSASFTGSKQVRDENGRLVKVSEELDYCAAHNPTNSFQPPKDDPKVITEKSVPVYGSDYNND